MLFCVNNMLFNPVPFVFTLIMLEVMTQSFLIIFTCTYIISNDIIVNKLTFSTKTWYSKSGKNKVKQTKKMYHLISDT